MGGLMSAGWESVMPIAMVRIHIPVRVGVAVVGLLLAGTLSGCWANPPEHVHSTHGYVPPDCSTLPAAPQVKQVSLTGTDRTPSVDVRVGQEIALQVPAGDGGAELSVPDQLHDLTCLVGYERHPDQSMTVTVLALEAGTTQFLSYLDVPPGNGEQLIFAAQAHITP